MSASRRNLLSLVGIGGAACAACCAGPLVAFLGGLGIAGLAGTFLIGAAGLLVAAAALVAVVIVRRRRRRLAPPRGKHVTLIPIHDATAPIACRADAGEIGDRLDQIERLHASLDHIERTEHGGCTSRTVGPVAEVA